MSKTIIAEGKTTNEAIEKGLYFEESGSISDEDLDSAFHVIVKLQKDLQKRIERIRSF